MTPSDKETSSVKGAGKYTSSAEMLNGDTGNPVFVLGEKRRFYYELRALPEQPSENNVTIVVHATGLCGSDVSISRQSMLSTPPSEDTDARCQIHYWTHGEIGDFKIEEPLVLGHESAGIIHRCGAAVNSLKPGDRVALEPGIPCRTCEYCQAGRYNLCSEMRFAATPPHDGTLAKYYTLPESLCYKLPAHISLEEGALIEPLSVAVHSARLAGVKAGSSVLVFGAGPIGLLCCAVARAFGAYVVVAVDIVAARLQFARDYAATATYEMEPLSPEENAIRITSAAGIGEGAEIVIDATGAQACISTGIHAMKKGGTFVQAGLGVPNIQFPVAQLCSKEGVYRGSFRYGPGDYKTAIELVAHQMLSLKELITHRYNFGEAEKAFENVELRQGIKTIIYSPDVSGSLDIADTLRAV